MDYYTILQPLNSELSREEPPLRTSALMFGSSIEGVSAGLILDGATVSKLTVQDGYLQSSNFKEGSEGWRIDSDGNMEMSSGTFRGNLVSAKITSSKYETHAESDKGLKIFTEAPAAISGNTGTYLPTANAEPAAPYNGFPWTDPENAYANDGVYATAVMPADTKYHIWKGFTNLQAAIPTDATITGITVLVEAKTNTAAGQVLWAQLTKDGSTVVGDKEISSALTTSDVVYTFGASDNLWGTTWARTDFTSSFGVMINGNTTGYTYSIDYIQIIVHYTRTWTNAFGTTIADAFIETWNGVGQSTLLYLKKDTQDLYIDKANLYLKGGLTIAPTEIVAGDTGAKSPTDNTTPGSPYNNPWSTPTDAYSSDNAYATATWAAGAEKYHIFKHFDLTIPQGATITGIEVVAEAKAASAGSLWVWLTKDGFLPATDYKYSDNLTTSDVLYTYGGSSDLWQGTLTPTWTKNDFGDNFGVMVSGNTDSDLYSLDHIYVTVYYTTTTDSTLGSNIIPSLDDTFDIGSSAKRIGTLYARNIESEETGICTGVVASATLRHSNDGEGNTTEAGNYTKVKETRVDTIYGGSTRIKFDGEVNAGQAFGKLYKNGAIIGVLQTIETTATYTTFTEDFTLSAEVGDLLQVYVINDTSTTTFVTNFRLYFDLDKKYINKITEGLDSFLKTKKTADTLPTFTTIL